MKLSDLNKQRKPGYKKEEARESFLSDLNTHLREFEFGMYEELEIHHPIIFTVGVPRSGTTILTQTLAHCFDFGYINNFAARFWMAPLSGIRLAQVLGIGPEGEFKSDYGTTTGLGGIHDFGYYWRHWLKKDDWEGVKNARELEKSIDWPGLTKSLANLQKHFGKPMVFKNIFGAYHMERFYTEIPSVHFVYIRRDMLDNACSILEARRKFYRDPATWWSTMPLEYEQLKDTDPWQQSAGQVYFLDRYYRSQLEKLHQKGFEFTEVDYEDLVENTAAVLKKLGDKFSRMAGRTIRHVQPSEAYSKRVYPESGDRDKLRRALAYWRNIG